MNDHRNLTLVLVCTLEPQEHGKWDARKQATRHKAQSKLPHHGAGRSKTKIVSLESLLRPQLRVLHGVSHGLTGKDELPV